MIKNGKVVDLGYSLKNSEGEVLDRADSKEPFTYLHGAQQIVPGLETSLDGLNIGDKKQVTVQPEQGYGVVDPRLKMIVKRTQFPDDADLKAGMRFFAESEDGQEVVFVVESIEGEKVHVDGNHPLAGQVLHFDVEVLAIREATAEELQHGHAHGPHGHDHDHDHNHHDHEHGHDCDHDHGHEEGEEHEE